MVDVSEPIQITHSIRQVRKIDDYIKTSFENIAKETEFIFDMGVYGNFYQ